MFSLSNRDIGVKLITAIIEFVESTKMLAAFFSINQIQNQIHVHKLQDRVRRDLFLSDTTKLEKISFWL